jgi:hypothetical protein
MKVKLCIAWVVIAILGSAVSWAANTPAAKAEPKAALRVSANLPLSFEPTSEPGRYFARSGGYAVYVGATESYVAVASPKAGSAPKLHFAFEGSNAAASMEALDPLPGITNYYFGSNPKDWRLGVKNFAKLRAKSIYPGVDVVYYGDQRRLEFDFVVAPKADAGAVTLAFNGIDKLSTDANGDLVAELDGQPVHFAKPYAYQQSGGETKPVNVEYALAGKEKARLKIGYYDKNLELVIDPIVSYSTYFGGAAGDTANGIAVDANGNSYITGATCSPTLPGPGATNLVTTNLVCTDGTDDPVGQASYVSEINKAGTAVLFTTILAGDHSVTANAIALDSAGNSYIAGTTTSTSLPDQVQPYFGGDSDAFVAEFDTQLNLVRTTNLGGTNTDTGLSVAVDYATPANVIVSGRTCSDDFPIYKGIERKIENCVAFVTKLDNLLEIGATPFGFAPGLVPEYTDATPSVPQAGGAFYFSTYLGGHPNNIPNVPLDGDVWNPSTRYVYGDIISVDINEVSTAFQCVSTGVNVTGASAPAWAQTQNGANGDGGIVWVNEGPVANLLITALTDGWAVAVDPLNDVFAVGGTTSGYFYPTEWGNMNVGQDHTGPWIVKLSKDGGYIYGEAFGTNLNDAARAVAVDSENRAYVAGESSGGLFGLTSAPSFQATPAGLKDAFVARFRTDGSDLEYLDYLGGSGDDVAIGIAVDASGEAYVTGSTASLDFPTVDALVNPLSVPPGIPMSSRPGSLSAFVTKISSTGTAIAFSSYLGGSQSDSGFAIAIHQNADSSDDVYVAGNTTSPDFPVYLPLPTGGTYGGKGDAFLAVIPGESLPSTTVSPLKLSFAAQTVFTVSPAQMITLTNSGNAPLIITNIPATVGDFQVTNNCLPNFAAGATCTLTVTYTPSVPGPESGTLTLSITGGTSPSISLSGVGTALAGGNGTGSTTGSTSGSTGTAPPGFDVAAPSAGLSVAQGQSASVQLSLTPKNGFAQTVALTCSVPTPATCVVSPTSVALSSSIAANATVTVTVPSAPGVSQPLPKGANHPPAFPWQTLPLGVAAVVLIGRRRSWLALLLGILCLALISVGCGGKVSTTSSSTLAAGTGYTLTVTETYTPVSGSGSSGVQTTLVPMTVTGD